MLSKYIERCGNSHRNANDRPEIICECSSAQYFTREAYDIPIPQTP